MTTASPSSLIPVTLLTGFLGSGKTTVLNHLVRQPELADALVMEMSSGCLCCSIRGDLVKTLRDINWRFSRGGERQFRRVLIETTGLADPAPIIHTLMTHPQITPKYRLDGIVTVVDIATGVHTLDQHPEAVKQAAVADTLLLTKADLVSSEQGHELQRRLDGINPAAPRWEVRGGEIAPQKVLNLGLFSAEGKTPEVARWLREEAYVPVHAHAHAHSHHESGHGHAHHPHDVNRHDDHIRAFCFHVDAPIPDDVLTRWLDLLMAFVGSNILRVKGILNVEGSAQPIVVHGVQHLFHPPVPLPAWPSADRRSRLVFITQDVDRTVVERTLDALRQARSQAGELVA